MRFVQEIRIALFAAVCGSVFLAGCGTTSMSRFYTLSPVQPTATVTGVPSPQTAVTLSVGPITIPDYLDRPQIVVRSSQNELLLSEFNRWAGSLQSDTARVLRENLEKMLAGDGLSVTSWRRGIPSGYRVSVDVSRFESTDETVVVLKAQWAIFGGEGGNVLLVRDSNIREEVHGSGIEPGVAAMGRALESLSREIAQGFRGITSAMPGKAAEKTG